MKCINCKSRVFLNEDVCPVCGAANKYTLFYIFKMVGSIACIAIFIGLLLPTFFKGDNKKIDVSVSKKDLSSYVGKDNNAYFVYDQKNKIYLLYGEDNKRINSDYYEYASNFVNGIAYVSKDGKSSIINTGGNTVYDKSSFIMNGNGLFIALDDDVKKLFNKDLNVIETYDMFVNLYTFYNSDNSKDLNIVYDSGFVKMYDVDGKLIYDFSEYFKADESITGTLKNNILFLSAKGCNSIVFDIDKNEIIGVIDSKSDYKIYEMSSDKKKIILYNYSGDRQNKALLINGNVINNKDYDDIYFLDNSSVLVGTKDNKKYILDDNLNTKINLDNVSVIDENSYAIQEGNNVSIIKDGNSVNDILNGNLRHSDYRAVPYYTINNSVYDRDGKLIITLEKDNIYRVIDSKYLIVSDKKYMYYLSDINGNKISDAFKSMSEEDTYLIVKDKNRKEGIIDFNGNQVIDNKYDFIYNYESYIKACDNKLCTLFNKEDFKEIGKFNKSSSIDVDKNYYTGILNKKRVYYSKSGKVIYETKK